MGPASPSPKPGSRHFHVVLVLSLAAAAAVAPAAIAAEGDGILVQRNEAAGTTTIIVSSRDGLLEWHDLARAFAQAAELDPDAVDPDMEFRPLDLNDRSTRSAIRALSAAVPDVHLRVRPHPVTGELALHMRIDRDDARGKIRLAKRLLRKRFAGQSDAYGLDFDDDWNERLADRPLVVLIHGYTSGPDTLEDLHDQLTERDWPCARFSYPNDGPLMESGKLLASELRALHAEYPERQVAIVAHSMGGLVARVAIEYPDLDPSNVTSLVMVFTPNQGTDWAELPLGLEIWDYLQHYEEKGFPRALRVAVRDGLNEARSDLKPSCRFLRELNGQARNPCVRYSLILGTGAPLDEKQRTQLEHRVRRVLTEKRAGQLVLPKIEAFLERLDELESGKGDGVVAVEQGKLDGVEDVLLLPVTHWALSIDPTRPAHRELYDTIHERLAGL